MMQQLDRAIMARMDGCSGDRHHRRWQKFFCAGANIAMLSEVTPNSNTISVCTRAKR
jgi:hypothetical protein